ncbi:hypothetical protein EYC80_002514 [Monilinia laxa]|uniref:Uncharacterized protein n=1 Tax=Monilinia laxa TaxID=61186 RepID=A0A5N6K455_MONLA|nr:hypothetical protein EYC80_002514 [Monilinia laxa]
MRGEWNRNRIFTQLTSVFNETILDIEEMQKVLKPTLRDWKYLRQDGGSSMALDRILISQIGWKIQLIAWWEMYFTM